MHWKSPSSPMQKKARQSKSKFKAMMICPPPDIRGTVHVGWVSKGQTVIQVYYKEVLTNRERVRRRPEIWKNGSWFLHRDNAPAHNALSFKTFLTKHKITVLEQPPYSPELAPCDLFFLFTEIKSALRGTRFESVDAVKAKATELMNKLPEDDLQHCFQQWKIRMERCRDRGGEHIEGDNISIMYFINKNVLTSVRFIL